MSTQKPTNQYDRRKADTKRRLSEAIERLQAGEPRSPAVRARKWKLDVKTIAQEAGVSRNAIYQNHTELIDELRAARTALGAKTETKASNRETRRLKRALHTAKHELRMLVTQNANLLARAARAENELKELRAHNHRRGGTP